MRLLLFCLAVASINAQTGTDDENILNLWKTLIDEDCKCVPYYLCNDQKVAVDLNDPTLTGFGVLDERFGDNDVDPKRCMESTELCCKDPTANNTVLPPNPERLKGCGYSNPKGLDFVLGNPSGRSSQYGEFPWVVALLDGTSVPEYVGGGVLIHPQVVITAAHIAKKLSPGASKARAGEWDTKTEKERLPHQDRLVQEIYQHKDFNPKPLFYDIALIKLAKPMELSDHINVICLPDQNEAFDSYQGCVSNGWGKDSFGPSGKFAEIQKKIVMNTIPHAECNELLRRTRLGRRFILHSTFNCAGAREGIDMCTGDGGGPLACPIGKNQYKLTGLVSWGIGCATKDVPGVYAAVPKFRQWIDSKMEAWGFDTSGYKA